MILRSIRVRKYKNILDSGEVEMQPDVTCLVGKNESGKSALLQALYRLNPVSTGHPETFVDLRDYPRREFARERESVAERRPIAATFELEDEDVRAVEGLLGPGALTSRRVTVARSYGDRLVWEIGSLGAAAPGPEYGSESALGPEADALGEARDAWEGHEGDDPDWEERLKALAFDDDGGGGGDVSPGAADDEHAREVRSILAERLPAFLYFDEYSAMPGRLSVRHACAAGASLAPGERSVLSLIRLAGIDLADFTRDGYEARKASLEAAAGDLTREVFEYWSQNRDLSVEFDVDFERPDADGYEGPFVELRIRNLRHGVTLNFSDRSQGFTWFFSLLASLSQLDKSKRLILLLDEPGTSLHGSAQQDLLRFIDERLVPVHQVVYSTHSPFLLDPKRLDRVRMVEDRGDDGSRVSGALFDYSNGTRLPLEVALGQHLVRSLDAGSGDLLVNAPSDHIYLRAMSARLESLGRACLDPRWRIVPVGGLDGVSAFGALVGGGAQRMAVLFDALSVDGLAADSPIGRKLLEGRGIIRIADFVPARPEIVEEPEPAPALDGIDFVPAGEPLPDRIEDDPDGPAPELAAAGAGGTDGDPPPAGLEASPFAEALAEATSEAATETETPGSYGGELETDPEDPAPFEEERPSAADVPPDGEGLEIEDLFAEDFFLDLVHRSGAASVEPFEVRGAGGIVRRIEAATGIGLDRFLPARVLLEAADDPLGRLDGPALDGFEALFMEINKVFAE